MTSLRLSLAGPVQAVSDEILTISFNREASVSLEKLHLYVW